jgi:hypothetical protein
MSNTKNSTYDSVDEYHRTIGNVRVTVDEYRRLVGAGTISKEDNGLETIRTEYRTVIGRSIIGNLTSPVRGGVGGPGGGGELFIKGPDYNQDTGDYNQSGGGDHQQNSGNYTQSP